MVTVKDVAREAGVSLGTVSNVLNGKESVKPFNRERVYRAMKKLGFQYNMTASALRTKTTKNIGLIIPTIVNPFYPEMARGVEDEARNAGFTVFLCNSDRDEKKEGEYIDALLSKGVDGIILFKPRLSPEYLENLNSRTPLVVEDWDQDIDSSLLAVSIDGYTGIIQGMNVLARYGHRRIAFINGLMESYSSRCKMAAYEKSLKSLKIPYCKEYAVFGDYSWKSGCNAALELLKLDPQPTAVFAANDMMAIGAMKAIQSRGLRIPEDISVMGFDDIEMTQLCTPGLTTIHVPKYECGAAAFRLIRQRLGDGEIPADKRQIMMDTRLVMRESITYVRK